MIKYEGMRSEESKGAVKTLPAGPYVAKVLNTSIIGKEPDQQLAVVLDIWEGEYAGWYMTKFKADKDKFGDNPNIEVKYKGVIRVRIPNPDNQNARYPESDIRRFNDMIWRFEKSNETEGFHWDGDALANACAAHPLMNNNPVKLDAAALKAMFEALR